MPVYHARENAPIGSEAVYSEIRLYCDVSNRLLIRPVTETPISVENGQKFDDAAQDYASGHLSVFLRLHDNKCSRRNARPAFHSVSIGIRSLEPYGDEVVISLRSRKIRQNLTDD